MSNFIIKALMPVLTQAEKDECVTKAHDKDGAPCLYELAVRVEQAVLAKLAKQEPVAWRVHPFDYGVGVEGAYALTQQEDMKEVWERKSWEVTPLYAHPIPSASETEAFILRCDYCKKETDDPWHGSGFIGDVKSKHIHACDDCVHLLPQPPAPSVSPASDKTACVSEKAESESQIPEGYQLVPVEPTDEMWVSDPVLRTYEIEG